MFNGSDLVYTYDGSFEGMLCCVFESYAFKEIPGSIHTPETQPILFDFSKWIVTDEGKAGRVYNSIRPKMSARAQELVRLCFLSCAPEKEMLILNFLHLGFKYGSKALTMYADESVFKLHKSVNRLLTESEKFKGFVRFSVYGEVLVAVIEPKNFVLPLLAPHFCDRLRDESFMIYDKSHKTALTYQNRKAEILYVEELSLPKPDQSELEYRRLWKQFYKTIAIESRNNPKCRMTLMPKRYWGQLTELEDSELSGNYLGSLQANSHETLPQQMLESSSIKPCHAVGNPAGCQMLKPKADLPSGKSDL